MSEISKEDGTPACVDDLFDKACSTQVAVALGSAVALAVALTGAGWRWLKRSTGAG